MLTLTLPSPGVQVRPEEIVAWIKAWRGEPIEAWCAVDDRPLLTERGGAGLVGHFVEVDEMHGLTERAVERLLAVLHTEPDDPEVMGATSTAVAAATPDGDRLSPDSVLSVQPLSSASKPLTPQRLGTPAGSRRPRLTAAPRSRPPPPGPGPPAARAQGDPLGPRGGFGGWGGVELERGCGGTRVHAHIRRSCRLATDPPFSTYYDPLTVQASEPQSST